jgi:peptide/nickel transport system ATP-binding protein
VAARVPRLTQIPGSMPRLTAIPAGCAFHPRCARAFDRCSRERPERLVVAAPTEAACWLYAEPRVEPAEPTGAGVGVGT